MRFVNCIDAKLETFGTKFLSFGASALAKVRTDMRPSGFNLLRLTEAPASSRIYIVTLLRALYGIFSRPLSVEACHLENVGRCSVAIHHRREVISPRVLHAPSLEISMEQNLRLTLGP